jgi:hypothetical protein
MIQTPFSNMPGVPSFANSAGKVLGKIFNPIFSPQTLSEP